ncbi:MAG: ATP-binding protein [Acidobacteriaceae bacterium]|jgi:light-regulated signal transduction histidine kinase (bacteriophytochrome)
MIRRRRSIAARLSWMNALVSGVALLLAFVSFLAYNLLGYRQAAVNTLTAEAQIIGANSVGALVYNDPTQAQTTLSALSNSPDVVQAAVFTQSGQLFAQYPADGPPIQPQAFSQGQLLSSWLNGTDILVGTRITIQTQRVGTVYIRAHLSGLRQQAVRYALIAAAILLICLAVALVIGAIFRRLLSEPIVSLARTARMVSRYRDYSLRFEPSQSYDELDSLTEAFNEMLAAIQQRDAALEQARGELEQRVEQRTAQLRDANRELESFSYTVAHDLRGPLEIISNICYLIQTQGDEAPKDSSAMLERLAASVAEMSHLIDDLLNLSRATSAGLHLRRLDLSSMATAILEDLAAAHPGRSVEGVVQFGCHANADKGLMQVVLQNLLRNAWKFTSHRESARIEFGCMQSGPETVFYVRDDGAGFDQRLAGRLFKPFQRLHTEGEFAGTGIGLATVQRIVTRHEGKIWAEGETGKGATFYFTLGSPAE